MGKKRSNASKQKQANKATHQKKKNKLFGVTMKKGGGRERPMSGMIVLDPKTAPPKKGEAHKKKRKVMCSGKPKPQKRKGEEHEDFKRQMESLQERNNVSQKKKKYSASVKKKMLLKNMADATFVIDDKKKSTERLMSETTSKVGKLSGIGVSSAPKFQFFANSDNSGVSSPAPKFQYIVNDDNKLQLLATKKPDAWSHDNKPTLLECDNPYAALDNHDDSEGEMGESKRPPKPAPIQFAPPSFGGGSVFIDPDL